MSKIKQIFEEITKEKNEEANEEIRIKKVFNKKEEELPLENIIPDNEPLKP